MPTKIHLKKMLKVRRISVAELAAVSGVTRQTIDNICTGRHVPNVDTLVRLASALGCTVTDMLKP